MTRTRSAVYATVVTASLGLVALGLLPLPPIAMWLLLGAAFGLFWWSVYQAGRRT
jgi:hypothetical protein